MIILKTYSIYFFMAVMLTAVIQSCRETPTKMVNISKQEEINNYSDLFDSFWDTMNNNYNYFLEEEENWDDLYYEYSPKFKQLTTFRKKDVSPKLSSKEANLAFKYFADIINNIKDVHFHMHVKIPVVVTTGTMQTVIHKLRQNTQYTYSEEDGFKIKGYGFTNNPIVNTSIVRKIMKTKLLNTNKVVKESINKGDESKSFYFLSGFLKTDVSTMYISFNKFAIKSVFNLQSRLVLMENLCNKNMPEIIFKELENLDAIISKKYKNLMNASLLYNYEIIEEILKSDIYKKYLEGKKQFEETENMNSLKTIMGELKSFTSKKLRSCEDKQMHIKDEILLDIKKNNSISRIIKAVYDKYIRVYYIRGLMGSKFMLVGRKSIGDYLYNIIMNESDIYSKLFNPLTRGDVKKVILDLRGNGGGNLADARFFTDRFITKKAIFGYQRTKEGNGRFNYTPWLPIETHPHKLSIKNDIPIVVLLDKKSGSMSEISAMMIRSQGNKAKIIGDQSIGATAGIGNKDYFNGGLRGKFTYFDFYMPLMAFKNHDGKVIEGKGVMPDIRIIPTQEDISSMSKTKEDIVFNKALEVIRSMN